MEPSGLRMGTTGAAHSEYFTGAIVFIHQSANFCLNFRTYSERAA